MPHSSVEKIPQHRANRFAAATAPRPPVRGAFTGPPGQGMRLFEGDRSGDGRWLARWADETSEPIIMAAKTSRLTGLQTEQRRCGDLKSAGKRLAKRSAACRPRSLAFGVIAIASEVRRMASRFTVLAAVLAPGSRRTGTRVVRAFLRICHDPPLVWAAVSHGPSNSMQGAGQRSS
jgi:hypothetical protein